MATSDTSSPDGARDGARAKGPGGARRRTVLHEDILAGALFMAFALTGLYLGRNFEIGTVTDMGTGYVPRLVCFALLGLGALVLVSGLFKQLAGTVEPRVAIPWRSLGLVPASVFLFGLTIESIGLVAGTFLIVAVAALAARGQRPLGVVIAAAGLAVMVVAIFVMGLELPFRIWPRFD